MRKIEFISLMCLHFNLSYFMYILKNHLLEFYDLLFTLFLSYNYGQFERTHDPELPGHLLLEQYQVRQLEVLYVIHLF